MTYIFDMAEGTEYQGEELVCSDPRASVPVQTAPRHGEGADLELRLQSIEAVSTPEQEPDILCSVDIDTLLDSVAK